MRELLDLLLLPLSQRQLKLNIIKEILLKRTQILFKVFVLKKKKISLEFRSKAKKN